MKHAICYIASAIAGLAVASWFCSCTTITERVTAPDGTVTERTTQSVDADAFTAGANAITAIAAPKGRVVAEK